MVAAVRRAGARGVLVLVGAALVVTGCGDTAADTPPVSLVDGVEAPVGVLDNSFRPAELEVAAGTEVVWRNGGRNDHNILPVEGDAFGVEVEEFAPDDVYRFRFTEPGTHAYYCSLHGTTTKGMVGTIVVTG